MIIPDRDSNTKKALKFAGVFALVALVLIVVIISYRKISRKNETVLPKNQMTSEEKQKSMQGALEKANKNSQSIPPSEQEKKQKEMTEALNKANQNAQPVSQEESAKKTQDMLKAINEANRK